MRYPGIGIQKKLGGDFSVDFKFRDESKAFVDAVLEKSAIIGVRGEMTARYLESLGYQRERDFTVLGCPSFFTTGCKLPDVKPLRFDESSLLSLNSKIEHESKKVIDVLGGIAKAHPNYVYVPQRVTDMVGSYYGRVYLPMKTQAVNNKRFFSQDKTVSLPTPSSWISYLHENAGLSIGTRLHGSAASVLAGVPTFVIANDQRVTELAEYHNIPYCTIDDVKKGVTAEKLIDGVDFSSVHRGHEERFNNFVDFLEKNGLKTAYSENRKIERVYFDSVLDKLDLSFDERPFSLCPDDIKAKRSVAAAQYYADFAKKQETLKREARADNAELRQLLKEAREQIGLRAYIRRLFK